MAYKYSIFFVPHFKNRKKISPIRAKLSRKYKSIVALQYPVHMTIALGTEIKNYKAFEKELRGYCATQKPRILKGAKYLYVKHFINWCGIHIISDNSLKKMQKQLQKTPGLGTSSTSAMI